MDDSLDASLDALGDHGQAVSAANARSPGRIPEQPGLYSWWGDAEACGSVETALEAPVGPLLYVGQAGAGRSTATLASRVQRNHLGGRRRRSTFRRTLVAVLAGVRGCRPADLTEDDLTAWMVEHLSVATVVSDDRSALHRLEAQALRRFDPPLNLMGMPPSPLRVRLRALRAAARQD